MGMRTFRYTLIRTRINMNRVYIHISSHIMRVCLRSRHTRTHTRILHNPIPTRSYSHTKHNPTRSYTPSPPPS